MTVEAGQPRLVIRSQNDITVLEDKNIIEGVMETKERTISLNKRLLDDLAGVCICSEQHAASPILMIIFE